MPYTAKKQTKCIFCSNQFCGTSLLIHVWQCRYIRFGNFFALYILLATVSWIWLLSKCFCSQNIVITTHVTCWGRPFGVPRAAQQKSGLEWMSDRHLLLPVVNDLKGCKRHVSECFTHTIIAFLTTKLENEKPWQLTCCTWVPYTVVNLLSLRPRSHRTQSTLRKAPHKQWDTLFTQVARNIKGLARKFACKSAYAFCVNWA